MSCLTTSSLSWYMDLTFQVPMQYCFLQHRTLLPSPVPSTTGFYFCFGSISSSFLELFLHWSPSISILGTYRPGDFIFQYPNFLPFHAVHGFSRQEFWSGFPFPSPVDHILSNSPPWPNSMKLWAMLCRATQDGWVMVESSDKILTEFQILSMKTKLNISKPYIDCMLKW